MNTATTVPGATRRGSIQGRWNPTRVAAGMMGRAALAVMVAGAWGCRDEGVVRPEAPIFPAQGKVTFEGEPAAGAFVVFSPKAAPKSGQEGFTPRATVRADGTFSLTSATEGDGAPAGDYAVTVRWSKPVKQGNELVAGPNVIPKAYADPATTPLQATIRESDNELEPFAITRK
ncbi:hypothetical protein [Planctomyces sp. SH-PL62]|uniref:hypothetical protein n=1 Tax=Planctomyces sp. SH-PL62 TaxID=1636152 RepID=UPI00083898EF|nr:hypothetical protein [Planctomyces sp. SH-PL62]